MGVNKDRRAKTIFARSLPLRPPIRARSCMCGVQRSRHRAPDGTCTRPHCCVCGLADRLTPQFHCLRSYLILDTLPAEYDSRVKAMEVDEKPTEDYSDIGGLEKQIQELVRRGHATDIRGHTTCSSTDRRSRS